MAIGIAQRVFSRGGRRLAVLATAGLATGSTLYALNRPLEASDLIAHPPKMDWPHKWLFNSFDHASIRRGWEVYKQVCAACHSLNYVHYRSMVDVFLTEEEARLEAADVMIEDGPDDTGNMYMRPGKLSDHVPGPYKNQEAARAANNGAYPPDLSLIVIARDGGEDYIFSLLTGYTDPPAGMVLEDGQYFNPYFLDGGIGMAQALYDEVIEYTDGTPASASQLAKDVTTFLAWCSMPEHDERKLMAMKFLIVALPIMGACWYWKRHTWIQLKTRKIALKT
uniref:Cytochrome c1, heme protein, mitochondrial n=1 Tax=Aceria tosichella TaxID=561515 RepID=A0A6G1SQA4_9ACAR